MEIPSTQSARALLESARQTPHFSSGCSSLDDLLSTSSPGLPPRSVLELTGPPGVGKTRTILGFVLAARFDAVHEGRAAGEVLVIEASLSPQLIHSSAVLYAQHHSHPTASVYQVCQGIHYKRIYEVSLLVALFHSLPSYLEQHPEIKLVVLDSLSSIFRPSNFDYATRNMIVDLIKSTLTTITLSVSAIISTHLTLKLYGPDGAPSGFSKDAEALLIPTLNDTWIGGRAYRVVLYFDESGERWAHLIAPSSASQPSPPPAPFAMDALGPCDHPK
ncbi:hypothetical protein MNV49_007315 [Pseudohyphozyma bogoriensis]|nr:hypothetical protein MNV49_007315 [Pseudohyphozyma bogoriensis]